MVTQALASAVVMGLLVVAIMATASRFAAVPTEPEEKGEYDRYESVVERLSTAGESPTVLAFGFVVVALLAGLVAVVAVGGFNAPEPMAVSFFGATLAVFGLLISVFLFLGPYVVTRQHGLGNAYRVAAGMTGLGAAFLALVVAQLTYGVI